MSSPAVDVGDEVYNVGITIINQPFWEWFNYACLYQRSMVIWGMIYYCYTHIINDHAQFEPGFNLQQRLISMPQGLFNSFTLKARASARCFLR